MVMVISLFLQSSDRNVVVTSPARPSVPAPVRNPPVSSHHTAVALSIDWGLFLFWGACASLSILCAYNPEMKSL